MFLLFFFFFIKYLLSILSSPFYFSFVSMNYSFSFMKNFFKWLLNVVIRVFLKKIEKKMFENINNNNNNSTQIYLLIDFIQFKYLSILYLMMQKMMINWLFSMCLLLLFKIKTRLFEILNINYHYLDKFACNFFFVYKHHMCDLNICSCF